MLKIEKLHRAKIMSKRKNKEPESNISIVIPARKLREAGFKKADKYKIETRKGMLLISKIEPLEPEKKI